jgi:hypothetical protein
VEHGALALGELGQQVTATELGGGEAGLVDSVVPVGGSSERLDVAERLVARTASSSSLAVPMHRSTTSL